MLDARDTARAGSDAGRERGVNQNDIEYCAPRIQTLESYSPLTRPLLGSLALPLLIFTLGLFTIVINACLLYVVHWLMGPHFEVDSFGWAMLGSVVISLISLPLNLLTGGGNARVKFQRHQRPPENRKPDDSGGGPIIDV